MRAELTGNRERPRAGAVRLFTVRRLAVLGGLGVLLGCGGILQPYASGVQVICDAPNTCQTCADAPPDMTLTLMAHEVSTNLWNPSAIELFEALAAASPETKVEILRSEATANGIQKCALADFIESREREAWRSEVEQLCALSAACSKLDPTDPSTVAPCVEQQNLSERIQDALEEMDRSTPQTLADGIQGLAMQNGQSTCALASVLRNARPVAD